MPTPIRSSTCAWPRYSARARCSAIELMASWRARAGGYPDELVSAMVERALNPRVLGSWAAREALVARGDDLAVQALLSGIGYAVVGSVLALNRVYLPHTRLKWQRHLIAGLEVVPGRLTERLELLSAARHTEALQAAEALLTDIVLLAEARTGADLGSFREELSGRRRAIGPPPG